MPLDVVSNSIELVWVPSDMIACGHVLIFLEVQTGTFREWIYLHVPGPGVGRGLEQHFGFFTEPYYFKSYEFNYYLSSNKKDSKRVVRKRYSLDTESKSTVSIRISRLMEEKFAYEIVKSNCQSFVEKILEAAKVQFTDNTKFDCPGLDFQIDDFKNKLQTSYWYKFVNQFMSR